MLWTYVLSHFSQCKTNKGRSVSEQIADRISTCFGVKNLLGIEAHRVVTQFTNTMENVNKSLQAQTITPRLITLDRLMMKFNTDYFMDVKESHEADFLNGIQIKYHAGKRFNLGYECTYDLMYWGDVIGYLHAKPNRRLKLDKSVVAVEFENSFLYNKQFSEAYFELLRCEELALAFKCFTRIDVAADTNQNILNRFEWFDSRKKTYRRNGRLTLKSDEGIDGVLIHPFAFYNKSSELVQSGKEYVRKFHEANLSVGEKVYRAELRLDNKLLRNARVKLDHTRISNTEYLLSVFNYFSMRDLYWTKPSDRRSGKKYYLIPMGSELPIINRIKKTELLGMTRRMVDIHLDKLVFAQMCMEQFNHDEVTGFYNDLVGRYKMFHWENYKWLTTYAKHIKFVEKHFNQQFTSKMAA